ncbi:polysaccharide pyruvyl transferase family protein [Clostridium nigeriense]|uniref:polysaccharide pyruvyl transferase family protein n=1 Tax=Clostridium nigeriense TaxID=1805470 RepID=UPI003D335408
MKICIITIYNSMNYGAYMQAYATYSLLTAEGHDVYMYETEKRDLPFYIHALHLRDLKNFLFNFKLLKKYVKDWKEFKIVRDLNDTYDLVIIGSDELWNVDNYNFSHEGYYIGKGINSKEIITYAVSANTCTLERFCEVYGKGKNILENLDGIGVRDKNTLEIASKCSNIVPTEVLDPTFLPNSYKESSTYVDDYILIYGYYFTEEEKEKITIIKNIMKKKIVSVGFKHDWCDLNIPCSPLEFVSYVKNASFVITSTFHGTVFSIMNNKQFATFARKNSKIHDVLKKFNLEKRNITSNNCNLIVNNFIEYDKVNSIIKARKKESLQFLTKFIK